jgi:uncharacterized membrane protein YbhN (UPF0104 family)
VLPTPGGLGTVDAGLTAALVDAGANEPAAIAAVLLFRSFTYVLPLVTGTLGYVLWRTGERVGAHGDDPAPAA